MRPTILIALVALVACRSNSAAVGLAQKLQDAHRASTSAFDRTFTGATMRFDYVHTGTATEEHIALSGWRIENEWAGSRVHLVDDTDLGKYRVRVFDGASHDELFSRGFSSIYGEWETTGEAKQVWKSFEESQRFPEPRAPVEVALEKRGADGRFHEFWRASVDPKSRFVDRAVLPKVGEVVTLRDNGPVANRVDLLVVADGYTAAQRTKFIADARRLVDVMFETQPYKRHADDFNVRCLFVPASEEGISNPRKGVWRDSPFDLSFNAFDSDRYVLAFDDRRLRDVAAQAPYDALIFLFNERKYGGGGIYNLWATVASDTEPAPYIFVHEFGHSFAGLADEYYTSQVAYEEFNTEGVEPWEPNVTALLEPKHVKWGDLVAASTPVPTPWNQKAYDDEDLAYQKKRKALIDDKASEEASEALMREIKTITGPMLEKARYSGQVGAFEGAAYQAKGLYRPEVDCIMFTRNPTTFCKVCERAIERVIGLYAE